MQDRPDKASLLDAVAVFLTEDLRPQVRDKALAFKVLITANLARIVANEIRHENEHDSAELARLQMLLPNADVSTEAPRAEQIQELNTVLVERIRDGNYSNDEACEVWSHVMQTLREKLSVINPRFDARPPIV